MKNLVKNTETKMEKEILFVWAAAHTMTVEQKESLEAQGEVVELKIVDYYLHQNLINIAVEDSNRSYLIGLAKSLLGIRICNPLKRVVIVQPAGSPSFQACLGRVMDDSKDEIWYAISERKSEDIPQQDGTIKKISVFQHRGWTKI